MLDIIKTSLRITHDKLDNDIQLNINACLLDMERVGVNVKYDNDLVVKACELYVKWQYNYADKGEQYKANYEKMRDGLSLSEDYKAGDIHVQ